MPCMCWESYNVGNASEHSKNLRLGWGFDTIGNRLGEMSEGSASPTEDQASVDLQFTEEELGVSAQLGLLFHFTEVLAYLAYCGIW